MPYVSKQDVKALFNQSTIYTALLPGTQPAWTPWYYMQELLIYQRIDLGNG